MELTFRSDTKQRKLRFMANSFAHPAKLVLPLQLWLIEHYTKLGDWILDPMAGSGTLLVACSLSRNVILIELEEKFVRMCEENWKRVQEVGCELGHTMEEAGMEWARTPQRRTMNHKGQPCPYREITCQEGICTECQVWQDRLIELRKRWIKLRQEKVAEGNLMKKENMKVQRGGCPNCRGDLMLNYKGRRHLAKCIRCSKYYMVPVKSGQMKDSASLRPGTS